MILQGHVWLMARYNRWRNALAVGAAQTLGADGLTRDRGAFFGSILRTFYHILWADRACMARIDGWPAAAMRVDQSADLVADWAVFTPRRAALDTRIRDWAGRIGDAALLEGRDWRPGGTGKNRTLPVAVCVMQMFNHQSHHRGQIHAMRTVEEQPGWMTEIPFRPDAI